MNNLLYLLKYNPEGKKKFFFVRTKDLHLYLLDMSQLCYYYINPHILIIYVYSLRGVRTLESNDENIMS